MTEQEKALLKKFATDLGLVLGASKQTAYLKGLMTLLKMNKQQAQYIMKSWLAAESLEEGTGLRAIKESILKLQSSALGAQDTESEESEEVDNTQQSAYAKLGKKLDYINTLNGKCPEGYEVEKYLKGGCVKCKKGSKTHEFSLINVKPRIGQYSWGGNLKSSYSIPSEKLVPLSYHPNFPTNNVTLPPMTNMRNNLVTNGLYDALATARQRQNLKMRLVVNNPESSTNKNSKVNGPVLMLPTMIRVSPTMKCGGKTKKKEVGGTLNTSWMTSAATTNKGKNLVKADKCGGKTKKHLDGGVLGILGRFL